MDYLQLPVKIRCSHAYTNIKNLDIMSFVWSVLACIFPVKRNKTRISVYRVHFKKLNLTGLQFPMKFHHMETFENLNRIKINVFSYKEDSPTGLNPIRLSKKNFRKCANLLLLVVDGKQHYVAINCIKTALKRKTLHNKSHPTCLSCYQRFTQPRLLLRHMKVCESADKQVTKCPENEIMVFKNFHHRQLNTITVYAGKYQIGKCLPCLILNLSDWEAILPKVDHNSNLEEHVPCGYGYIIVSPIPEFCTRVQIYRGEDCVQHFIEQMEWEYQRVKAALYTVTPLKLTDSDIEDFAEATTCSICFKDLGLDKVFDHSHLTGVFRGAAHNLCNLKMTQPKNMIVYMHNAKGYDNHFIIRDLVKKYKNKVQVLGTKEKFIRIKVGQLIFQDSYNHLSDKLEVLASNLKDKGDDYFPLILEEFPIQSQFDLCLQKLPYPYSYMDSFTKFECNIPPIEEFYNVLTDKHLAKEDYRRLKKACRVFNITTMGELHDLYLKVDVLLLASVFEFYRSLGMTEYKLDPSYYVSAPSFSFDAMLFMTDVKLEILSDEEMYTFIEKGRRGGISSIFKRLATANCQNVPNYDSRVQPSALFYTDCVNLYGYIMSLKLPRSGFRWLTDQELSKLTVERILEYSNSFSFGMILEVDLHYPPELFDLHKDLPLAPENLTINEDMLSEVTREFLKEHNIKVIGQKRLAPNFFDKTGYVAHIENIKFYLEKGLILLKIRRGVIFEHSCWLKPYIDLNTRKRKEATSTFEKGFYKLLINSAYGKTLEDVRAYKSIKIISGSNCLRYINKIQFSSFTILDDDLVALDLLKSEVNLCKPIYVGMTILDLSKLHMMRFHYDVMKPTFHNQLEICFTDTDSFLYQIYVPELEGKLEELRQYFDFSNYPREHPLYSEENKATPGKFKDEMGSIPIVQFCGLRAKCYSILSLLGQKLAAAGVKKAQQELLKHQDYVEILAEMKINYVTQRSIQSTAHRLYTKQQKRIGLSALDIKRFVLNDAINTVPFGYFNL